MHDMNMNMEMTDDHMGMEMMGGHDGMGMMGMEMGPMVYGMPLSALLMMAAGVFYLICAIAIWKPFRKEKDELVGALFAFLVYQTISMFFMGYEMKTMNILYSNIAALATFVGSAYMLKFPLSSLSEKSRKIGFMIVLILSLGLFTWFMQTPDRQMQLMSAVLWYDIVINGIIVGGSILVYAFRTPEKLSRSKALGGGTGVVSCCVVANVAMLGGALFTSTIFAFLAPVFILWALRSRKSTSGASASVQQANATTAA